ncbi:MAG: hypothetical protein Q7U74_00260, partial [Saprospiraceae bacterium]|nr:hypothetical protein [Saprospiraceae bacterium]
MSKIITYHFSEDFIEKTAQYMVDNCRGADKGFDRTAVVFGGKRPALFLKQALARKLQCGFASAHFFAVDDFVRHIVSRQEHITRIRDMEACYAVYSLARKHAPQILKTRETFAEFLPWAREIISFIDQLDLGAVSRERLLNIEMNAEIGYEVPPAVNILLGNIVFLRERYHEKMREEKKYSRGLLYLSAARQCPGVSLEEFDHIIFCNFFDLHETEKQIIKRYYDSAQAVLLFQKDGQDWPKLNELAEYFGAEIEPRSGLAARPHIQLYAGFDTHSQASIVREILTTIKDKDRTVIVLPQADSMVPLLSEISSFAGDYNVSMGYPVRRSTLYSLLNAVNRAQKTRKKNEYYCRDYLAVIMHPLFKNLVFRNDPAVTRVLVHKI